uniref:Uncharacterized protein n=1 Tax=Triticum urartu TaxID=4572 RepID=A0A8R7P143_TRIUA
MICFQQKYMLCIPRTLCSFKHDRQRLSLLYVLCIHLGCC